MPIALGVVRVDLRDVDRALEGGLLRAGRIELKSPRDATKASADRAHHHVPHREVDLSVRWIDVPEHLFPLYCRLDAGCCCLYNQLVAYAIYSEVQASPVGGRGTRLGGVPARLRHHDPCSGARRRDAGRAAARRSLSPRADRSRT